MSPSARSLREGSIHKIDLKLVFNLFTMTKAELLLKTALCCMASDGTIAPEEIDILNRVIITKPTFESVNAPDMLKEFSMALTNTGMSFVDGFLLEVENSGLSKEDALELIDVAFNTIEADNEIEYAEVAFFKKIRSRLSVTDDEILARWPDKEDFLLPDIMDKTPFEIDFSGINFNTLIS